MFQIKNMIKNILNQTVRNPKINHIRAYKLKNVFDNFTKQGTMLRTKKKQINNATKHFVDFHGQNPWPKFGKNMRNRTMSVINKTCKTIYLKFTFQGSKKTTNLKKNATKHVIENHVNLK